MTARVPSRMTRFTTGSICACMALAAQFGLTACSPYQSGGAGRTADSFGYPSTSLNPQSLQLRDTRTGEVLWTYDIPIDRKIAISFAADRNKEQNPAMPDEMCWAEWPIDQNYGSLDNRMPVPGPLYRRLDVFQRKAEPTATTSAASSSDGQ
ncbi:MAG: hypothetical protein IT435_09045 [Phycisphaerales bacterium]|nr:hypothetical protein [Phycisphaerales bacterium]